MAGILFLFLILSRRVLSTLRLSLRSLFESGSKPWLSPIDCSAGGGGNGGDSWVTKTEDALGEFESESGGGYVVGREAGSVVG